jgi:hypothetical protein
VDNAVGVVTHPHRPDDDGYDENHPKTRSTHLTGLIQMALLETEMVRLEEIFLPYFVDPTGKTFFEAVEERGFLLPEGPNPG